MSEEDVERTVFECDLEARFGEVDVVFEDMNYAEDEDGLEDCGNKQSECEELECRALEVLVSRGIRKQQNW